MKRFMRLLRILAVFALFYLIFPGAAYAYLDPGTGSYILQLLMAGLVGLLFATKLYWNKIKTLYTNLISRGEKQKDDDDDEEDED